MVEIYESHSTRKGGKGQDAEDIINQPGLLNKEVAELKKKMKKASENLEFEEAAKFRDKIKRLELLQLKILDGSFESEV